MNNRLKLVIEALEDLEINSPETRFEMARIIAIQELEKQLNGGWTNAIEKPSKSDDYLVYYHKKYNSCNFETNWHGICSFIDIYGGWQTEEGETILAWQSLPEPYSELNYSRLPVSKCPTCKSTTINKILSVNHCPDCGQKLDWSEVEDE